MKDGDPFIIIERSGQGAPAGITRKSVLFLLAGFAACRFDRLEKLYRFDVKPRLLAQAAFADKTVLRYAVIPRRLSGRGNAKSES